MSYAEADSKAKEINSNLKATDPRLRRGVQVIHEEGTTLFFMYAFALRIGEYIAVFTEHHGYMVYHDDDVSVRQFKPIYEEIDNA